MAFWAGGAEGIGERGVPAKEKHASIAQNTEDTTACINIVKQVTENIQALVPGLLPPAYSNELQNRVATNTSDKVYTATVKMFISRSNHTFLVSPFAKYQVILSFA